EVPMDRQLHRRRERRRLTAPCRPHIVAGSQEHRHECTADKARCSGDENPAHALPRDIILPRDIVASSVATSAPPPARAMRSATVDDMRIDRAASTASAKFTPNTDCTTVMTENPRTTASW